MGRLPQQLYALPLLAVYAVADRRMVRADAGRWAAIARTGGRCFDSPPASLADVLATLGSRPEFRSLFYFRARTGALAKIAARAARVTFWPGAVGLLIDGAVGPGLYIE